MVCLDRSRGAERMIRPFCYFVFHNVGSVDTVKQVLVTPDLVKTDVILTYVFLF